MREPFSRKATAGVACAVILLAGCAHEPASGPRSQVSSEIPAQAAAFSTVQAAPSPAATGTWKSALADGIAAYDRGDFREAARRLAQVTEDPGATLAARVEAHKFQAFALCSNDLRALCRLQFERALALDPSFELEPAERGHPIWGPEFQRAKSLRGTGSSGAAGAGWRAATSVER